MGLKVIMRLAVDLKNEYTEKKRRKMFVVLEKSCNFAAERLEKSCNKHL